MAVLLTALLCFVMPNDGFCQLFGAWPGSYSFGTGYFSGGIPGFGSYQSGIGPFSPTYSNYSGVQTNYNTYNYGSPSIGFGSLWGSGNSYSTPQTFGGFAQGGFFSPGLSGGFSQTAGSASPYSWSSSASSGSNQSFGWPGSSGTYLGGFSLDAYSRYPAGGQSFMTFNPISGGGYNPYSSAFQNPVSWTQSYNALSSYVPTSSSGGTSDIKEMPPVSQDQGDPEYVSDQILVKFHTGVSHDKQKMIHDKHDCKEIYESEYGGFIVIEIPSDVTVHEMVNRYLLEAEVEYAEPNYIRHSHLVPNDTYFSYQWHHSLMKSTSAWDLGKGTGVVVAVVDSGVAYRTSVGYTRAPDLAGTLFKSGWDFVNGDPYPDDDNGHGTHMAGCIAQTTNNYLGVAGVAYGATILPVKVMDASGSVSIADEVDGIYFAVNNGAHIINLSLGGEGESVSEEAAIDYAVNSGVVVICSAGNSGSNTPEYPASYHQSISVSAVRYDRTRPSYSNYGADIDICAPGGDITVDQNYDYFGDGILQQTHNGSNLNTFYYYFMEGTSPATALVSGVAALIIGKSSSTISPAQVKTNMTVTATDLGATGWDQYYGWGLVNAYSALLRTT